MDARVSLKLATKASFEGKKNCDTFLKQKRRSATKKYKFIDQFGMLMSGLDIYFLKVRAHALLKVATKGSFRGKKSENLAFLGYFSEEKSEECS